MTATETPDSPRYGTPVNGYLVVKDGTANWYTSPELAEHNAGESGVIFVGPECLGDWLDKLPLRPHRPRTTMPAIAPFLTELRAKFEGQF